MDLSQYFLMFMIYSMIGWCLEVILIYFKGKHFVNRGFLIGPYCPIYGIGGVLITLMLTQYKEEPITLFVMAVFICGLLEYFTSYMMEKLFKARWWDYSNNKYNINGRVCILNLVLFGILGCFVILISNPILVNFFHLFSSKFLFIIASIVAVLFAIDLSFSFKIIANFRNAAKALSKRDNTEEISRMVKETLDTTSKLINNRLVKAFPNVRKKIDEIAENMRKLKEELDHNAESNKKKSLVRKIKNIFKKED